MSKNNSSRNSKRGAQAPLLGSKVQVKIEKLATGGAGVARHEGLVIFVQQSAPDDELLVEITLQKKNFAEARIVQVLKPGPARRSTPCPVADRCGGCNWQHIHESEQQKQKEQIVHDTLKKFLRDTDFSYLPIKPSPQSFRYRNRIQPKISNGRFGFYERESHRIVEISDCPITEDLLAREIPKVREWALNTRPEGRLEMYLTTENEVRYGFVDGEDDGIGFSQVNRFQNRELIQTVLDWAGQTSYKHIYDLYAGSGNFTFPLYNNFESPITAVELSQKLVKRGQELTPTSQIQFVESDVEKWLKGSKIGPHDLVILDPPRAGCSEATMKSLAQNPPKKIIYISCHPVSLARDLKWLADWSVQLGQPALRLKRVQAFEMFPQTDHVETIAELEVDS